MTQETKQLISRFTCDMDLDLLPSIITGMQEEDNVSGTTKYKNCFKGLRNIAAHEPSVIISQWKSKYNEGCSRIVFECSNTEGFKGNRLCVEMVQLTAWMFDMYLISKNKSYIDFWHTLMNILYPSIHEIQVQKRFKFDSTVYKSGLIELFLKFQDYMYDTFGKIRTLNVREAFIAKLYEDNQVLFWKIVIPDMFSLVELFIMGVVDLNEESSYRTFLEFIDAREGASFWRE